MSLPGSIGLLSRMPTPTSSQYGNVDGPSSATDNALVRFDGTTGKLIQNGVVTEDDYTGTLNGPLNNTKTTAVGIAYTNQPANDGVEIVSDSASDTQTATVIGTTNGTDTTVAEAVVLTGTTPVSTVKVDWGVILAIKLSSAAVGTITVREASGDATITTLAAAATSSGVTTVTDTAAYNRTVSIVADGATTKQIGLGGTNTSGTQIYDSQALTGTTAVTSNSSFYTLTEIYRGDLESSRTVTTTADGTLTLNAGKVALPITDDTTTNATMYPTWVTAATGNLPIKVSSTKLSFNPSTGTLSTINAVIDSGTGALSSAITGTPIRLGHADDVANGIQAEGYGTGTALQILGRRVGGTRASNSATPAAGIMLDLLAYGYTTALTTSPSGRYTIRAKTLWSATNSDTEHIWTATPTGSTTAATALTLDATGLTVAADIRVATKTPASAAATGTLGTITWDASFLYVCTATDTWKRVAIATW